VEDLYIEDSLHDRSIDNISDPDRILKLFKSPGPDGFFPA